MKSFLIENKENISNFISRIAKRQSNNTLLNSFVEKGFIYIFTNRFNLDITKINLIPSLMNVFFENINFKEFTKLLIDFIINSINQIKKITSLKDFVNLFLKDAKIMNLLNKSLKKSLKNFVITNEQIDLILKRMKIAKTKQTVQTILGAIEGLIEIINKNDFLLDIIIRFFGDFYLKKDNLLTLQNFVDYIFKLEKKEFWDLISNIDLTKVSKKSLNNITFAFDLIISAIKYKGRFFQSLVNLSNPENLFNKNTKKINPINTIIYFEKIKTLKKPLKWILNDLIEKFYLSKDKSKQNNIYYKSIFRIIVISLFVLRQLFQKNLNKNIFVGNKLSITYIFLQMIGYKHGKNKGIDNLILDIINESQNYNLEIKRHNQNIDKRPILLLNTFDKDSSLKEEKLKHLWKMLKDGYIE